MIDEETEASQVEMFHFELHSVALDHSEKVDVVECQWNDEMNPIGIPFH